MAAGLVSRALSCQNLPMHAEIQFTVEDYRELPETGPRYQLVDGDLIIAPAPNRHHQLYSRNLQFLLSDYLRQHPYGELYDAPFDVILSETDVFQPDLVFISQERLHLLTDAGLEGAPDWVVEILSPRTSKLDREIKRRRYAKFGVQILWIIEPETRRLLVYDFSVRYEHPVAVYEDDAIFGCRLIPGLELQAAKIFAASITEL